MDNKPKGTMKGQLTIYGLMWFFMTLMVYWALNSIIGSLVLDISRNLTAAGDTTGARVVSLIPTVLAVAISFIPVQYAAASSQPQQYQP